MAIVAVAAPAAPKQPKREVTEAQKRAAERKLREVAYRWEYKEALMAR